MGKLTSVLLAEHPGRKVAFYRALGVPFEDEDEGVLRPAADVDDVHLVVVPTSEQDTVSGLRGSGTSFFGLWVPDLDAATKAVADVGAPLLIPHDRVD